MGKLLLSVLSIVLCLAFIGILLRLIVGFGTLVLSGKILWLALLVLVGVAAIFLIRKAVGLAR